MKAELQISIDEIAEILPRLYFFESEITVKVLKNSENMTFLVIEPKTGIKRVFRINRPDYHNERELESEFMWMEEISRDTELKLPKVYKGLDGSYLQHFTSSLTGTSFTCCMFSFLEGQMVGTLKGDELLAQIHNMGKILAALHLQWQNRNSCTSLDRFSWDLEQLFGENARWGDWHGYWELTPETTELIEKAVDKIIRRISAFSRGKDSYGMIHADLHSSNIIINAGEPQIFDFDDCGYGWFLYDFGCSLVEYSDGLDVLISKLIEGYETVKKLAPEEKVEVRSFVLLRRIVRMAWLTGHRDSDTAKGVEKEYFKKTCEMAACYLYKMK